jgi:MFS family permease
VGLWLTFVRIVFRSLQGIGAAGTYSLAILISYDMLPKAKLALNGVYLSISVALATLTGPLFGGLINEHSTWRWIFYIK